MVTGVSGSGKSSLAFDTLYAGDSGVTRSRFRRHAAILERLDRPDVDTIEPVPPRRPRAEERRAQRPFDVGTQTEIHDSLRLLFAHGGTTFCPACGVAAVPGGVDRAVEELFATEAGARVTFVAPLAWHREAETRRSRKNGRQDRIRLEELKRAGFFRALSGNGETVEIGEDVEGLLDARGRLPVVVGRFVIREESRAEITHDPLPVGLAMAACNCSVFGNAVKFRGEVSKPLRDS